MICNINGYNILIEEFNEGFGALVMPDRNGIWIEIEGFFETAAECQQAAISFIHEQLKGFEAEEDNYQAEVFQFYDIRDYL